MGVMAPEWYISSFVRSAVGIGATAPHDEIERVGEDLVKRRS
jgi:hypothetical protein